MLVLGMRQGRKVLAWRDHSGTRDPKGYRVSARMALIWRRAGRKAVGKAPRGLV